MSFDPLTAISDLGNTLIKRFFPDKIEQAQKLAEFEEMKQNGDLKRAEVRMSAIVMEAKSSDKWTSRARPSFLYVMYLMILSAIPMGVLYAYDPQLASHIATGMKEWLAAIPTPMWWLFGSGYLGYDVCRTVDKGKLMNLLSKGIGK